MLSGNIWTYATSFNTLAKKGPGFYKRTERNLQGKYTKKGVSDPLKIVVGKIILWLKQCGSIQRRGIFFGLLFTGTTNTSLLNSVANK